MARTSPCFYIAPTAISVSPNANGSASDIAVNVVRGAKIKVYSPGVPALGYSDVSFQQWTLTGRNRRLADNTKPYSIYARLAKSNKEDGYLVFAPKVASGTEWLDKYAYVTVGGLATGTANKNSEDYWYVKLGEVSLPTNNARTVTLDTGILGTDKFNTDWNIDPDQMPLRIELSATIDAKDAGDKPYVEWDKKLTLKANLLEGWANANVQRFHHFTIQRNTGDELSDKKYNYPDEKSDSENPSSGRQMDNGIITLSHARGTDDVFNGTVSSIWTVIAWGLKANVADNTSSSSGTSGTVTANVYEKLAEKSINIMAETGEQYALEMSSSVVNYDPSSGTYNPKDGIDVMVRATDQRGKVFKLTNAQLGAANLFVQYSLEDTQIWSTCDSKGAATAVAKANIPIKAFEAQKNVNVRIVKAHYLEIYRSHIAFIRKGEKGDKGDPGTPGKDAVTYGVQVTSYYKDVNGGHVPGLQFGFTKTTGATVETFADVRNMGCAVEIYGDGTYYSEASGWINKGHDNFLFSTFPYGGVVGNPTLGDASVVSVKLYLGGTVVATASYANGKQGADGIGALEISVDPDTLVFDTNDDGIVPSETSKRATIACYRDGKKVTNVDYALMEGGHPDCDASISASNGTATVTISNIAKDKPYGVSKTSGTVEVQVYDKDKGRNYFPMVKFSVNVAKFNGGLKADNKKFESAYNYLTNNGTSTDFSYYESHIKQTAKEISLKVSEKSVGRRNMLVGSACRKYGDGFTYMSGSETAYDGYSLEQIEINSGIDGVNCIHCRTKRTGTDSYYLSGFRWWGISPQGNIKLEKGKNYVLSFYAKTPAPNDMVFVAEILYEGSKIDTSRPNGYDGPTGYSTTFSVSEANKWELFTVKLSVPSNAKYEYEEINIFARSKRDYFVDGYICKPMLEEGEEYNGWTLSEQDYDYIGGNLIDNSRTFASGGNCNVRTIYGSVIANVYNSESSVFKARMEALAGSVPSKYSLPSSASSGTRYALDSDWSVWQYNGNSLSDDSHYNGWQKTNESLHQDIMLVNLNLELNKDYIISWYAKCEGNGFFGAYATDVGKTVYSEYSDGGIDRSTYGENIFFLTTQWKRFWMHVKLIKGSCSAIAFRQYRGDWSSGSSAMTVYFTQPKIEEGATVTDWTEKRTDMVDKEALYATGIDIENKKITLTADKTYVRSNDGDPIAVFSADGGYINSDILNVQHVYAKDDDGTVYGHFGYKDATGGTSSSGKQYPLWVGAANCDTAPFAVSSTGDMYANSGMLGPFSIGGYGISSPSFDTGTGMKLGFLITLKGATFNNVNNQYEMAAVIGGHTEYGDPISYLAGGGAYSAPTYRDFNTTFGYGTGRSRQALYVRKKLSSGNDPSTSIDIHGSNGKGGKDFAAMIVDSDCMGVNSPSSNFFGGMACGLLRVSSLSGTNLTAWNENRVTVLVAVNSSEVTIPLPTYPEVGQMIWIIQQGGRVNFTTDVKHPIRTSNTSNYVTSGAASDRTGQINIFIWDGSYWNSTCISGGLFK